MKSLGLVLFIIFSGIPVFLNEAVANDNLGVSLLLAKKNDCVFKVKFQIKNNTDKNLYLLDPLDSSLGIDKIDPKRGIYNISFIFGYDEDLTPNVFIPPKIDTLKPLQTKIFSRQNSFKSFADTFQLDKIRFLRISFLKISEKYDENIGYREYGKFLEKFSQEIFSNILRLSHISDNCKPYPKSDRIIPEGVPGKSKQE